jgi:hypothetical protein
MADIPAPDETGLAAVPVASWSDGSTVHSVVVPADDDVDHQYWVVHDGRVIAKCPSLAAVDEWRLRWDLPGPSIAEPSHP